MSLFDKLPLEILHMIAKDSEPAYKALVLSYPRFARSIDYNWRLDFRVHFRHKVRCVEGRMIWSRHRKLHRLDGPAISAAWWSSWYRNGLLHRVGGPAMFYANGDEEWYQNGKLHRDDGPAVVNENGNFEWYQHGKLHRDDGPASFYQNVSEEWYRNGVLHRDDGPASIDYDIFDNEATERICRMEWYRNGVLHCESGPAVIDYSDNSMSWHQNGKLHRVGGPAIIDGTRDWYENGVAVKPNYNLYDELTCATLCVLIVLAWNCIM